MWRGGLGAWRCVGSMGLIFEPRRRRKVVFICKAWRGSLMVAFAGFWERACTPIAFIGRCTLQNCSKPQQEAKIIKVYNRRLCRPAFKVGWRIGTLMMRLGIELLILQHATLPDTATLKMVIHNSDNLLWCWVCRRNSMGRHRRKKTYSTGARGLAGFG